MTNAGSIVVVESMLSAVMKSQLSIEQVRKFHLKITLKYDSMSSSNLALSG